MRISCFNCNHKIPRNFLRILIPNNPTFALFIAVKSRFFAFFHFSKSFEKSEKATFYSNEQSKSWVIWYQNS